ncbi:MAG: hypothetical protein JWP57_245 [Spirosoma sp.]|nr:hypothetical protein [Spirosoma sp.]
MKYPLFLFILCLIPLFPACHHASSEPPVLIRQHYVLTGPNHCDTTTNKGVDVTVNYFLLKEDSRGAHTINDSLRRLAVGSITGWLDSTTLAPHLNAQSNLATAATLFAADYETMISDMGGMGGCWELKMQADTLYTSAKALTVRMETYAYTGGAHPNSNRALYMFDRETGHTLSMTDLVSDTTALLDVVERAFRRQQEIRPHTNLEEHGYFLRDGRFFLPANIGLSRAGMVFCYNPYEIAAYAVGPIEVTVPYAQLSGILRSDGPL